MQKERNGVLLGACGFVLIAVGALLPESQAGLGLVGTLAFGGGIALVTVAQAGLMQLPTDDRDEEQR